MLINFIVPTLQCTETLIWYFLDMKTWEKIPSKVRYFSRIAEIFSTAGRPKNQPKFQILFYKNSSMRDLQGISEQSVQSNSALVRI